MARARLIEYCFLHSATKSPLKTLFAVRPIPDLSQTYPRPSPSCTFKDILTSIRPSECASPITPITARPGVLQHIRPLMYPSIATLWHIHYVPILSLHLILIVCHSSSSLGTSAPHLAQISWSLAAS